MQQLDQSRVTSDEIDALGHLNVRFYLTRVDRASQVLLDVLGLGTAEVAAAGCVVRRVDTYSQFKREQFEGAELSVFGGILAATDTEVRCYFEIRNPARAEIAAVFVTGHVLIDPASQQRRAFPDGMLRVNEMYGVRLPDYAAPRSLSLDPPRTDVRLAELETRIVDDPAAGMMTGRREGVLQAEDCDASGYLREDVDLMFILHRQMAEASTQGGESFGPPIMRTAEGHRFSWAMMETRSVALARPRIGDDIVFLGADVGFAEKSRQSRRWAFVRRTGQLVSIHDTVGIAIDLDARKSIPIPPAIRAVIERTCLPDYA